MYGSFPFAKWVANPVGLKTAAVYPNRLSGLYANSNVTKETAELLLKKNISANDALLIARSWENNEAVEKLAQTDKRATVLLELLYRKKATSTVLNRFMETPALRKSKTLTGAVVLGHLDELPLEFTDTWFETAPAYYKMTLASRKGSKITDETVMTNFTYGEAANRSRRTTRRVINRLLAARPGLIPAAIDKDADALEYAILSTSDEETLTYIANKIVNNVKSKITTSELLMEEIHALQILFRDNPTVPDEIKKYCVEEINPLVNKHNTNKTKDSYYFFSNYTTLVNELETEKYGVSDNTDVYAEKLIRLAVPTSVIITFVERYTNMLTNTARNHLIRAYKAENGSPGRNINNNALTLLRLLTTPTEIYTPTPQDLSMMEKMSEVGYENYCRSKTFVPSWIPSFEINIDSGRKLAQKVTVNYPALKGQA